MVRRFHPLLTVPKSVLDHSQTNYGGYPIFTNASLPTSLLRRETFINQKSQIGPIKLLYVKAESLRPQCHGFRERRSAGHNGAMPFKNKLEPAMLSEVQHKMKQGRSGAGPGMPKTTLERAEETKWGSRKRHMADSIERLLIRTRLQEARREHRLTYRQQVQQALRSPRSMRALDRAIEAKYESLGVPYVKLEGIDGFPVYRVCLT